MRKALIALVLLLTACNPTLPTKVDDARVAAQAQLDAVVALAQQAVVAVEFVCEVAPDSKECEILSTSLDRLFAATVFVQDSIDLGRDVQGDLEALYAVTLKLLRLADAAKRSIA